MNENTIFLHCSKNTYYTITNIEMSDDKEMLDKFFLINNKRKPLFLLRGEIEALVRAGYWTICNN